MHWGSIGGAIKDNFFQHAGCTSGLLVQLVRLDDQWKKFRTFMVVASFKLTFELKFGVDLCFALILSDEDKIIALAGVGGT